MTRKRLFELAVVCLGLLVVGPARAASWRTNVNYGASTAMDLYVPDRPATSPAVVVSLHYCGGNAGGAHSWFQSYADQYGFIIIAPKSAGSCFDAGLGRSGERANIVKMVEYVVAQNSADPKKVFAAGPSSGACMTQALLASYPALPRAARREPVSAATPPGAAVRRSKAATRRLVAGVRQDRARDIPASRSPSRSPPS